MSAREFAEWKAYYKLEPWGPERMDAGFAMLAYLVSTALRRKKSDPVMGPERWMPEKWLPYIREQERKAEEADARKADPVEMQAKLFAFARQHGATFTKPGEVPDGDDR